MKITKVDIVHSKNMLKALGRGKWEMEGMEILAFADMMRWFASLQNKMEVEVADEEAKEKFRLEEQKKLAENKIEPKPLEDPIKPLVGTPEPIAPKLSTKKQKG